MEEWDTNKNTITPKDITIGSDKQVWWQCQHEHSWQASPMYRSKGFGNCLSCESIAHLHPEIAKEWATDLNDITPWDVRAGSGKKVWWRGKDCGHTWQTEVRARVRGSNCVYCTGQKVLIGFNDLETTHPNIAKYWNTEKNTRKLENTSYGLKTKVWWTDECGHSWHKSPLHMTKLKEVSCPVCESVAILYPELLDEWNDNADPYEILPGSSRKISWKCNKNPKHVWKAAVYSRTGAEQGCPYCSGTRVMIGENDMLTTHAHLEELWDDRHDIQKFSFGSNYKAQWRCKKDNTHSWVATVSDVSSGKSNCPHCSNRVSSSEQEILEYIRSLGFKAESNRTVLQRRELDIYIPARNLAIEYNGVYWHSDTFMKDKNYHYKKWSDCKTHGIQLITVWEDDYTRKPELVKEMLAHKLGVSSYPRIAARKTKVVTVEDKEAEGFYNEHHIQGHKRGKHIGLRDKVNNTLVAVSTWKEETSKSIVYLERYATNRIVQGGFSKVLKYAENYYKKHFDNIVTFSDNTVSDGKLYENSGFIVDKELPPDYCYLVRSQRVHKFNYRKKRFKEDPELKYEEGLTERELAKLNGMSRIWDCGKIRWVKQINVGE